MVASGGCCCWLDVAWRLANSFSVHKYLFLRVSKIQNGHNHEDPDTTVLSLRASGVRICQNRCFGSMQYYRKQKEQSKLVNYFNISEFLIECVQVDACIF